MGVDNWGRDDQGDEEDKGYTFWGPGNRNRQASGRVEGRQVASWWSSNANGRQRRANTAAGTSDGWTVQESTPRAAHKAHEGLDNYGSRRARKKAAKWNRRMNNPPDETWREAAGGLTSDLTRGAGGAARNAGGGLLGAIFGRRHY